MLACVFFAVNAYVQHTIINIVRIYKLHKILYKIFDGLLYYTVNVIKNRRVQYTKLQYILEYHVKLVPLTVQFIVPYIHTVFRMFQLFRVLSTVSQYLLSSTSTKQVYTCIYIISCKHYFECNPIMKKGSIPIDNCALRLIAQALLVLPRSNTIVAFQVFRVSSANQCLLRSVLIDSL